MMYDDPVYVLLYGRVWVGGRKKKREGEKESRPEMLVGIAGFSIFFFLLPLSSGSGFRRKSSSECALKMG